MIRQELKKARKNKGLSQEEIAILIGVRRSTYSNYENGIRTPNIDIAFKLKKILNVDDKVFLKKNDTISSKNAI